MASSQRPQHASPSHVQINMRQGSSKDKDDCSIIEKTLITSVQLSNGKTLNKNDEGSEFQDDSLNRKCLISCRNFLCENLTVVEVVVYLQTHEIVTQNDADSIRAKVTPYEKNEKLIEFVQQRGPEAFSCFMKSLTETRQKYIFDKIIEERRVAEENNLSIQRALREIYSKSYRNVIPFSLPYFFDIERKWVNLTLKLEDDSTVAEDYAILLKKAFAKANLLIIEGDPGIGKSSLMQRLAYEWTQSQLSDYDLVVCIELRKLREYEFKDIKELITHYMTGYLDEEDYEIFHKFISDTKCLKDHKILVLLDGYDESSLEKQCQELSDFFNSTTSRPLRFNVLLTSRKGYLSKLRNQGRFIFADIIGFTTESQRQEYIAKHFNAENGTESSENTAAVTHLLNTNTNLKRLSESPLMLIFICLLHKKIIDGTEVELYMNIIWWMIDRYQKSNPNQDVPSLFAFQHNASDKFRVIENNYQHFPQLHLLGTMAMQDIFKSTFTETDLKKHKLNEIIQQVGFLRKEETRDTSYHTKTEFSFLHRTIQEFIMALTFFFSIDTSLKNFLWYVFFMTKNKGCGIIPAKINTFLNMIYSSKLKISELKKKNYTLSLKLFQLYSHSYRQREQSSTLITRYEDDAINPISKKPLRIPKSSEEAIQFLHVEAEEGDTSAQFALGLMYEHGKLTIQSHKKAVQWFTKSAEQGNTEAQCRLGLMCMNGKGMPQSYEEAVKWYTKSAEQGDAAGQNYLGAMYEKGKGLPQSYEEAVKWYTKSAEQGNATGQYNLGDMYEYGKGVPQSYEEAVKWYTKSAEQGFASGQNYLGFMYAHGKGVPQSNEEAVKWFTKSAEQGNATGQYNLGDMYEYGKGVPQSDEEAVKWLRKSAKQGNAAGQNNLGFMFESGKGVAQSYEEAVKWYTKSAEQGNASGQNNLGFMFESGKGVAQSYEEAVKWYTKSAEQGNASGQNNLGFMFESGKGVAQSYEEAVKWYTKSAEQGNATGQYNLGAMYENGKGVPQSNEEAVKWFTKSTEQGFASGQNYLGFMYAHGKGVPQSYEEAVKWYTKSAEQGDATGQNYLGFMYAHGKGVPQSYEEAVKWYTKSAEQGCASAESDLKIMKSIWWPLVKLIQNLSFTLLGYMFLLIGIISVLLYKFLNE